jgi:hypothetical protein
VFFRSFIIRVDLSECEMTQADMFFPDVQIVHNINLGFKLLPNDLQQVDVFLQVLRFSPPIKLTATI